MGNFKDFWNKQEHKSFMDKPIQESWAWEKSNQIICLSQAAREMRKQLFLIEQVNSQRGVIGLV